MEQNSETELSTVDDTQLSKSLDALLGAVGKTSLKKGEGVAIANSGTTSDGKPAGGGQGSMSDSGSIDDLMIARMSAAGIDAGTIAAFQAFMSEEDEEDEDEMGGYMGESDSMIPVPRPTAKSQREPTMRKSMDDYRSDSDIEDALDVSPFLEAFTAKTAEAIDGMRKSQVLAARGQAHFNQKIGTATVEIGRMLKSQSATIAKQQRIISEMGKRLGIVERAPVAQPKGLTKSAAVQTLSKSMPGEAGAGAQQLTKSQLISTLSYMNLEKSMSDINGRRTSEIIARYEGGGSLDENAYHAAQTFLAKHPEEAQQAITYA